MGTYLSSLGRIKFPPETSHTALLTRLDAVFQEAVANTRFYRSIAGPAQRTSSTEWLGELPKVELVDFLKHGNRFENAANQIELKRKFVHPSGQRPRTALVADGFEWSWKYIRVPDYRAPQLARLKADSIAGSVDTLRALAKNIEAGYIWIPKLKHSIVAFTGMIEGPVSEEDLDLFWKVFGVPVYEQFYGFGGELIAYECPAHQGLHVNRYAAVFENGGRGELLVSLIGNPSQMVFRLVSGLNGQVETAKCACGHEGPRIVNVARRTTALNENRPKLVAMAVAG